jgi:hypothetical protein
LPSGAVAASAKSVRQGKPQFGKRKKAKRLLSILLRREKPASLRSVWNAVDCHVAALLAMTA